jgi:hypothetical protein
MISLNKRDWLNKERISKLILNQPHRSQKQDLWLNKLSLEQLVKEENKRSIGKLLEVLPMLSPNLLSVGEKLIANNQIELKKPLSHKLIDKDHPTQVDNKFKEKQSLFNQNELKNTNCKPWLPS